jgi:FkbM family methyltransferase
MAENCISEQFGIHEAEMSQKPSAYKRVRRAGRELFGLRPWPLEVAPEPKHLEEQAYSAALLHGDFVLDVGANSGEVSLYISNVVGPTGKVIAFEPVWPIYQVLCESINGGHTSRATVVPINLGLAEASKTAYIQVPEGDFAYGSLASGEKWGPARGGTALRSYECQFTTIDVFLAQKALRPPDVVKIDVEGAELFVLQGATQLLADDRPPLLMMEVFAPWERALDYTPRDVLNLLGGFGYRFLFLCSIGLVAHEPTLDKAVPDEYVQGYNIIAYKEGVHEDRLTALRGLAPGTSGILPMIPPDCDNR